MAELTKRDLVKQCIEGGDMTKADIAAKLEMSAGSVSTQMTYLRWMDNYILTDTDTKILSFTDKDTFEAVEADRKANRKTKSTSTRTPEERAVATAKTIATQSAQLVKWGNKIPELEEVAAAAPDDVDAQLNVKEAIAMVSLLEVKITRNENLAATLPEPVVAEEEADDSDVEESDEDELL